MKPFIGITRFFRPDLTFRVAHVPFVVLKGISSSARCKSTPSNTHPHPKLESPDSSQHTSVANANVSSQKQAKHFWTPDELSKLKEALAKGMTAKAMTELFPTRSISSIAKQRDNLLDNVGLFDNAPFRKRRCWSADEINLLLKLHADGVQPFKLRAHFPDRSLNAIRRGILRYSLGTKACYNKGVHWTREDDMRLTELSQSMDRSATAKALGRSISSIERRAGILGVKFSKIIKDYTAEDIALVFRMRHDKASFKDIAEKLGRSVSSVSSAYYRYRPLQESDAEMRRTVHVHRLSPQEVEHVSTLRAQGVAWPDIGQRYPTRSLQLIVDGHRRYTGYDLSPDEVREVERLRKEGMPWHKIAKLDRFYRTRGALVAAYRRSVERLKSQQ